MRRYLFSLLLAVAPAGYAVEPLNQTDAAILDEIDARLEVVEIKSVQGERSLFVPRNAAVKEGDEYFVMASSSRAIDSFDRKQFKLGDTWNAELVEVDSGLKAGDFVLVKNKISERRAPLTQTLVSAPKKPVIKEQPKVVTKPKQTLISRAKSLLPKPKPVVIAESKPRPQPIIIAESKPKPIVISGPVSKPKPKPKPVAIAEPVLKPRPKPAPVAIAEPIRALPVPMYDRSYASPNPAPVSNYQPWNAPIVATPVFPTAIAVEVPCSAHEIPEPVIIQQHGPIHRMRSHFSGRHPRPHHSSRHRGGYLSRGHRR